MASAACPTVWAVIERQAAVPLQAFEYLSPVLPWTAAIAIACGDPALAWVPLVVGRCAAGGPLGGGRPAGPGNQMHERNEHEDGEDQAGHGDRRRDARSLQPRHRHGRQAPLRRLPSRHAQLRQCGRGQREFWEPPAEPLPPPAIPGATRRWRRNSEFTSTAAAKVVAGPVWGAAAPAVLRTGHLTWRRHRLRLRR